MTLVAGSRAAAGGPRVPSPLVALGECCRVVNGTTPAAGDDSHWKGDVVWVTPTDLGKLDGMHVRGSARTISRNALDSHNLTLCPPGSVVLSSRAPIGHLGIAAVPLCTNQGCKTLVPRDGLKPDYLYYALLRAVPDLKALGSGATFAEVSKAQVEDFRIPVPPLAEQERIAGRLTEQLAAVERARGAAQSRLAAAESLPAALRRAVFTEDSDWPTRPLGELLRVRSGDFLSAEMMAKDGIYPVYGGNGINGRHSKFMFEEPRVVIGRVGALCGCVHVTAPRAWITDNALYVTDMREEMDLAFLAETLRFLNLRQHANAMAQPLITGQLIYPLLAKVPPLPTQRRLAAELTQRLAAAEAVIARCRAELAAIEALPAALLRQAFGGSEVSDA